MQVSFHGFIDMVAIDVDPVKISIGKFRGGRGGEVSVNYDVTGSYLSLKRPLAFFVQGVHRCLVSQCLYLIDPWAFQEDYPKSWFGGDLGGNEQCQELARKNCL